MESNKVQSAILKAVERHLGGADSLEIKTDEEDKNELEIVERQVNKLKLELASSLQYTSLWDEIDKQKEKNKVSREKQKSFWFRVKKVLGF